MNYLIEPLREINEYGEILDTLRQYTLPVNIIGPSDSQKAHMAYSICSHLNRRGIFIAHNEMQARKLYEDFAFFLGEEAVFFPSKEIMLHNVEARSNDDIFQRIRALKRILEGDYKLIVTSVEAVSHRLTPRKLFEEAIVTIETGSRIDLSKMIEGFVASGYERVGIVEGQGQFAVRGGIIDIFSIDSDYPVRIELFGDEVDSIRSFDAVSQRSLERLSETRVVPAREIIYSSSRKDDIIKEIEEELDAYLSKLTVKKETEHIRNLKEKIGHDIDRFRNDYYFPGMDSYIPYIINQPAFLTDYADERAVVFVDEPARAKLRHENILLEHYETCKSLMEKGKMLPGSVGIYFDWEEADRRIKSSSVVFLSTMAADSESYSSSLRFSIVCKTGSSYQGYMDMLCDDLRNWKSKGSRVVILSGTRGRGERLRDTLISKGIEASYSQEEGIRLQPGQVIITHGSLNKGFEYPSTGFVVVSDREVFGQGIRQKKSTYKAKGSKINVFTDLNLGDYVVHQSHGIGQYVGIEKLSVENVKKDYLKIKYRDGDYLYIPTSQMDLIQKYIGAEGKAPRLNKLAGGEWAKTKKKVKESLKELAGELIKLYAQRQSLKGYAFSEDTVWQKQFEELFPYEETEDQLKCIEEIKKNMESDSPMDRLLCGDVGFGKTEVAIRAIFKAVMDGKQVAYLVPTTVLAQQHYMNFKERMKDFPVTVDMISRFRSPSEQKRIMKELKAGNVDVLIGTHRLLQKDIQFKDLGLLVVDEEQRFGVMHKERLKNLKPNIDVLTLTATPIPRTLHMSLVGVRDISVIEDPPEERYPVQTYVMEYDPDVIKDAISRELSRKGQVFYLYNRVRSIEVKAAQIQAMIPEARIAVAHGQMGERQLEDIMLSFVNGENDILVCTTIIESGLDMPNVNTIIVEDADRMGLAQLYQLRGRVGRSNKVAYAYVTYRKDKVLAEVAEKRLQAIKELTELGSGFKIAMRDLEIRGAGNLLGPEQHGHIESVGYDMYCRLLDEAVRELKGEAVSGDDAEVTIDLNISAYIDDSYISEESQKIEMYKKIASIQGEQDVIDIQDELIDRYGDLPVPVNSLVNIAFIKALGKDIGLSAVIEKNDGVILQIGKGDRLNIEVIGKLSSKYKRQLLFNAGTSPYLLYRTSGLTGEKLLENIKILLQDIKSFEVT